MEDDRVILLSHPDDSDNLTDPTGMFSMTEISETEQKSNGDENNDSILQNKNDDHDPSAMIYVAAVIASLGGLLFGYDIGIISGAKTQIQYEIDLNCLQIESIVAMLPVGAMIASLFGGKTYSIFNNWFIILTCIPHNLGKIIFYEF